MRYGWKGKRREAPISRLGLQIADRPGRFDLARPRQQHSQHDQRGRDDQVNALPQREGPLRNDRRRKSSPRNDLASLFDLRFWPGGRSFTFGEVHFDPATLHRHHRRLSARTDVQLGIDVAQVNLDRIGADVQRLSDLPVAQPLTQQAQELQFALTGRFGWNF